MLTTVRTEDSSIRLQLSDRNAVKKFFDDARQQSGFFLQLEQELDQFQRFTVTVSAPGFRFRCEAEVVQIFPSGGSFGTAFQLCDWTPSKNRELDRKLRGPEEDEDPNTSPMFRIKKMDVNQRFRLATKASRTERQILIRDPSPQVLLGLLAHPRIEDKEVRAIVDSSIATPAIMKRVAGNRKWMSNSEIQLAVVRSPKTPPPIAIQLLPSLRTPDLQVLAKGSAARENVRKAALKIYLQRIGRK